MGAILGLAETFAYAVRTTDTEIIFDVTGSVDLVTTKVLSEPFAESIPTITASEHLTTLSIDLRRVDLRRVDLIDTAGLTLLLSSRRSLAASGRSLQVFTSRGTQPNRTLRIGRFDTIMAIKYLDDCAE